MEDFTGGPGFLAFVFTFTLAGAGVLLFRSLTKHLRKVKGKGDEAQPPASSGEAPSPSTP
ncbi:hypothetical protein [Demequina zhanjiangensis]|uniref:Uncharacterized protein n=1 Tax=Demequina zhanjiangensis TaxID=3051659 RepID=A0ABT8G4N1_9MICO|nr:hypothetical protein [Demequina sp. SYSU T00b26]MDN4474086.1 hypothetical protein [Demequina sp. SYSU T00b26]